MNVQRVAGRDRTSAFVVPRERFEVDQFVRVRVGSSYEIGVVADIHGDGDRVTVNTRSGFDLTVDPHAVNRAFLVVLDLNGVLGARGRGTFVHRPYTEEFVRFLFDNFVVAVWTSGLPRSCDPIIESVLGAYQDKLLFTYYREDCTQNPTPGNPYGTLKNLQRIFDTYPKSFHSVNTIIIDDSPQKCSHPDIALCPVPFTDPAIQKSDDGLLKAMTVLREVLAVDSHSPLIRAAEERLLALQERQEASSERHTEEVPAASDEASDLHLEEVKLWKTRLCCENTRGRCRYGDSCRYSHDMDDGARPCSRKYHCRFGHANRWGPIVNEQPPETETEESIVLSKQPPPTPPESEKRPVRSLGTSHTGNPLLDAMMDHPHQSNQPVHPFVFSTNPQLIPAAQRSKEFNEALIWDPERYEERPQRNSRPQPPQQRQPPLPQQQHQQQQQQQHRGSQPSSGSRHRQRPSPSPAVEPQGRIQGSSGHHAATYVTGSAPVVLHLAGDSNDGTALLRQLQALTQQR